MAKTINFSIDVENLPRYHHVQELLSLADGYAESITDVVRENYVDLVEILGLELAVIIHAHFKLISCVKYFYTEEYIVQLASQCETKHEREKLAFGCGCSLQTIDGWLRESKKKEEGSLV